jgi:rhodanese-related sulfurtransferase
MMTFPKEIAPAEAAALVNNGALLVDVREAPEREAGIIPGAAHVPLSALQGAALDARPDQPVVFHCKGGARTLANAAALEAKADGRTAYLLQGGIEAWRAAGLPVEQP